MPALSKSNLASRREAARDLASLAYKLVTADGQTDSIRVIFSWSVVTHGFGVGNLSVLRYLCTRNN